MLTDEAVDALSVHRGSKHDLTPTEMQQRATDFFKQTPQMSSR